MANKVEFGISNLHVGTYEVSDQGVVTLGTPYHQKGAVSFTPEETVNQNDFHADDYVYWNGYSGGKITGDITVALFDDVFKTQFLGYKALTNGGLANVRDAQKPNVYIAFEVKGDQEKRRVIFYNGVFGAINRTFSTIEENKEPVTEAISITFTGDENTGVTKATLRPTDAGYETLFTAPTAPVFADESE